MEKQVSRGDTNPTQLYEYGEAACLVTPPYIHAAAGAFCSLPKKQHQVIKGFSVFVTKRPKPEERGGSSRNSYADDTLTARFATVS